MVDTENGWVIAGKLGLSVSGKALNFSVDADKLPSPDENGRIYLVVNSKGLDGVLNGAYPSVNVVVPPPKDG